MSIEQADKIVFGDKRTGERLHNTLHANGVSMETVRRGAYFEWLAKQDHDTCVDAYHRNKVGEDRVGSIDVEVLSRVVVEVHSATQPKGDGLPEVESITWEVGALPHFRLWLAGRPKEGDLERMIVYLNRCLSKPVRRLLAEFDITDERPKDRGVFALGRRDGEAVMSSAPHYARFPLEVDEVVCWIVPKSRKD